ncbi:MAG: hypothetical protein J5I93_02665 [Pirellulaceae bacterium]|nr:hypothetical protein [Pirellulaceae bacterium]
MNEWLSSVEHYLWQTELVRYLIGGGPLAWLQLGLLGLIFQRLMVHGLRRSLGEEPVSGGWHDGHLEALVQVCFALGLLLTFSGLYGYLAEGDTGSQVNLLKALGSSAIGYSAAVLGALAGLLDMLTPGARRELPRVASAGPVTGSTHAPLAGERRRPGGPAQELSHDVFPIIADAAGGGRRPVGRVMDDPGQPECDAADGYGGGEPLDDWSEPAGGVRAYGAVDHGDVAWDWQAAGDEQFAGGDPEEFE